MREFARDGGGGVGGLIQNVERQKASCASARALLTFKQSMRGLLRMEKAERYDEF